MPSRLSRTANAFGFAISPTLLSRAVKVIE
jgi:hypothetical protein